MLGVQYGTRNTDAASYMAEHNPLRYRSYYRDDEGFLTYYLQSRYYENQFNRFLNADIPDIALQSKAEINGLNLFAYCNNDPVNHVDPTGYKSSYRTYVIYYNGNRDLTKFAKNSFYPFLNPKYIPVKYPKDFIAAWNSMKNPYDVYLYLHGAPGMLCFQDSFMYPSSISKLQYKTIKTKTVYLLSCFGAKKGYNNENMAWSFAAICNGYVHACLGGVSYTKISRLGYIARSAIKNKEYGSWFVYYIKKGKRHSRFSSLMGL